MAGQLTRSLVHLLQQLRLILQRAGIPAVIAFAAASAAAVLALRRRRLRNRRATGGRLNGNGVSSRNGRSRRNQLFGAAVDVDARSTGRDDQLGGLRTPEANGDAEFTRGLGTRMGGDLRRRGTTSSNPYDASSGRTSSRTRSDSNRPKGLASVRRVTIGCDIASRFPSRNDEGGQSNNSDETGVIDSNADDPLFVFSPQASHDVSTEQSEAAGDETTDTSTTNDIVVRDSAKPCLRQMAGCDLYIIARVTSDEMETSVRKALRNAGAFEAGVDERKVLFCETQQGRVSMVRQIEPHLHIDNSTAVASALQRYIKFIALVGAHTVKLDEPSPQAGSSSQVSADTNANAVNVLRYKSLEEFLKTP